MEPCYKKEVADWMVNVIYCHYRRDEILVKMRMNNIAQTLVKYGCERIFFLFEWRGLWIITQGYLM